MKIKIFKINKDNRFYNYDYDDYNTQIILQGVTKWDEINREDYLKLNEAIRNANRNQKDKFHYFVIQEQEDIQEIFNSSKEFVEFENARLEKYKKIEAERRKKQEETKLARKQKQLAKLKKELELQNE